MDTVQRRFYKQFGTAVRKLRHAKGMTLEDMQEYGFATAHIQRIESGKKAISLFTAYRIAQAFGTKIAKLLSMIE